MNANLTFKRVDGKLLVNLEAALSQNYPQQLLAEPQFGTKAYCPYIIPARRSRRRKAQNLDPNYSPPKVKIVRKLGMNLMKFYLLQSLLMENAMVTKMMHLVLVQVKVKVWKWLLKSMTLVFTLFP